MCQTEIREGTLLIYSRCHTAPPPPPPVNGGRRRILNAYLNPRKTCASRPAVVVQARAARLAVLWTLPEHGEVQKYSYNAASVTRIRITSHLKSEHRSNLLKMTPEENV